MNIIGIVAAILFITAFIIVLLLRGSAALLMSSANVDSDFDDEQTDVNAAALKPKVPLLPAGYKVQDGKRGEPHTCPVCAAKFEHGETVHSKIFPPTSRDDRLLHISGCMYCLNGERRRECPVCGVELAIDEYLTARMFQRPGKSHVHVLGCVHCRGRR